MFIHNKYTLSRIAKPPLYIMLIYIQYEKLQSNKVNTIHQKKHLVIFTEKLVHIGHMSLSQCVFEKCNPKFQSHKKAQ